MWPFSRSRVVSSGQDGSDVVTENVRIRISQSGAKATAAGIRSVGTASKSAAVAVRGLVVGVIALGAAIGANRLRGFADEATLLQNRIRTVTDSTAEFVGVQRQLRKISNETRTSLGQNAELFQRLRRATEPLGTSTRDVLETTEGLSAAIQVIGARSTEATNGLIQLAQGLESNKFAGDELRSVSENLGPLFTLLAKELGTTNGGLRKLAQEGKLTAAVVFPALQRAASTFKDRLDEVNFTTESTGNIFRNEFLIAVGAINKTLQATDGFNNGIIALSKNIGVLLVQAIAFGVESFADLLRVGASVLDLLDEFGVQLPTLGTTLGTIGGIFQLFFRSLDTGFRLLILGTATFRLEVVKLLARLGLVDAGKITKAGLDVGIAQGKLTTAIAGTNTTLDDLIELLGKEGATKAAGDFADELVRLAGQADTAAARLRLLDTAAAIEAAFFGTAPQDEVDAALDEVVIPVFVRTEASDFAEGFGAAVRDSLEGAIVGAFRGEGLDAIEFISDLGGSLLEESLSQAFDGLEESLTGLFDKLGDSFAGGSEGLGGAIGGAIAGAVGIGLSILASELSGGSSNARNDLVRGAVESAQATRGVVAGPTSIPIFQFGQKLEDALIGTESLLAQILSAIQVAPAAVGGGGAGAGGGASSDLSLTTSSLA